MEVMGEVGDWEKVAGGNHMYTRGSVYSFGLGTPDSKLQEIKQQSYTTKDRRHLVEEYTNPRASWLVLGHALYECGEETALAMVKQYLPKGMWIS